MIHERVLSQRYGKSSPCGIKNDSLGPDDGKGLFELLVFLNPEIASNLQSNHPKLNSVSKNVFLSEFRVHLMT